MIDRIRALLVRIWNAYEDQAVREFESGGPWLP